MCTDYAAPAPQLDRDEMGMLMDALSAYRAEIVIGVPAPVRAASPYYARLLMDLDVLHAKIENAEFDLERVQA